MSPHTPAGTLPLAGRVGEGGAGRASLARKLRAVPTAAEVRLWRILHSFRTDGFHFRKQVAIGAYVVDFACLHAGLTIEADGDSHGSDVALAKDASRDDYLSGRGFTVLRFSNHDILSNDEGVYAVIAGALSERQRNHRGSRTPPPSSATALAGQAALASPARGEVVEASSPDLSDILPLTGRDGEGDVPRSVPDGDQK
jgi:very-short-patch-repair endonuclease